jgi:SSS family solute:Na+ symporter
MITIGDLFTERFRSPFLGGAFAVFTLTTAVIGGGASYVVAGKTMKALTPKPEQEWTAEERAMVADYQEWRELQGQLGVGLTAAQQQRYDSLNERAKRGELRSFVSYTNTTYFYVFFAIVIAAYTVLGGFTAAAITDAIQGFLIITFSVMLIPIGLSKLGGFSGLHEQVPDYMFLLFGTATTSDYAWYTILGMVVANLVSIVAAAPGMATAGSATNENTARFGMIGGMFFKRFIMLFWALAGLIAIGLYAGELDDPDLIWGHMTSELLPVGAIGLMLAGVLAANMSTLDAGSVSNSALFVRNLYQPLRPEQSERHYLTIGRIVVLIILLGGVGTAVWFEDRLLELFKYFISLPAVFGAAIWLGWVWRRLTRTAVIVQILIHFAVVLVVPNLFGILEATRTDPDLLLQTQPRTVEITTMAVQADVDAGLAEEVKQTIRKPRVIEATGVFFEQVVRRDPDDPSSPLEGRGRFHAEIWMLSWLGIDFSTWSKAQLVAARMFFDALFPFLLLLVVSLVTRPEAREHLDRFYGRLHTPVQPTPEQDQAAVAEAGQHPERFESRKLLPGTSWEILKPGWADLLGFGGSWVLVGLVVYCLWLLVNIGS